MNARRTGVRRTDRISFGRLSDISIDTILSHMLNPRVSIHLPLATFVWNRDTVIQFIETKEASWDRNGLGHWAILFDGVYVGWGGFQKEADEWDFGLVLRPEAYGLGAAITAKALEFARADRRIQFVTFLLAPSRRNLGGLRRLGATYLGQIDHGGVRFLKYRLEVSSQSVGRVPHES